jgi:hypothetical protein
MTRRIGIAGIDPEELSLVRLLVSLLRHPDPAVAELTKQALFYVRDTSSGGVFAGAQALDNAS